MRRLRIDSEAEADLDEAMAWYERQRNGLGIELPKDVGVRHRVLKRFPYVVMYPIRGREILVIAVIHGHQAPATWRSRLR